MATANGRKPLIGSERPRPSSHRLLGAADGGATIAVTLLLRQDPAAPALPDMAHYLATPLAQRRYLTPEAYAERHGASSADLAAVANFATSHGMTLISSHAGRRAVEIQGTAAQMAAAFGVTLNLYEAPRPHVRGRLRREGGEAWEDHFEPTEPTRSRRGRPAAPMAAEEPHVHYGYDGSVHLPPELQGVVLAVIGLDDRLIGAPSGTGNPPGAASLSVPAAAAAYNFPNTGASDQTIGIIAPQSTPGVGANYAPGDITGSYFPSLPAKFQTAPTLNNVNITIGGSTYSNNPAALTGITNVNIGNNAFASILEITQDISTSATIAQGATVNVYFTQNSEQGWVAFLNRVLQPQGETPPTVVSCSWVLFQGDDSSYVGNLSDSGSSVSVLTALFQQLASLGISVFIAIGDWGADNWATLANGSAPDGSSHVMYPATDPWVTACGGTVMAVNAGPPATITEFVWSDAYSANFGNANSNFGATGGGVSKTFPAPAYQTAAGITGATDSAGNFQAGRGVPDVAGMVGLQGFFANGVSYSFTGTSCVAPLYAGLTAVLRSALQIGLAPLNVSLYALAGSAFNDVTSGNNDSGDSPANVKLAIPSYIGTTADAPFFTAGAGWDACTGLGSIDGTKLLSGLSGLLYSPTWYFQAKKTTFGFDEVGLNATFASSLSLVLEGYSPAQVAAAKLKPTVTVALPGITVTVGAAAPVLPLQPNSPQRIFFPCTVTFAKSAVAVVSAGGLFPAPNNPDTQAPATSAITFAGQIMTAETIFLLESGADPYFSNWDAAGDNPFYLSEDLRVFTVTPGFNNAPFRGIALAAKDNNSFDTAAAYGYIQAVLNDFNGAFNDGSPGKTDPFASVLPAQSSALSADSLVAPTTPNPASGNAFANYAFAVARVRLTEKAGASTIKNVRVLFRLFASETSDTDYQPALTYPSTLDLAGSPQAPLIGVGNVTIPFFATGNYEANGDFGINTDYSANSVNNQPMTVPASGQGWAYYGCYLNIYPTGNTIAGAAVQTLFPATHACLVAQIAFDDAPIPTGQALGPENFDKLAQRNIVLTLSDNPGPASAHRIPQTFDLRPSAALLSGTGLAARPDELMIDWGKTPPGAKAHIYWPAVQAADVLHLAKSLYPNHHLTAGDANTIECVVPKGTTFVPIPPGAGDNFAGLFTVDLPTTVKAGEEFTIVVSRISTRAGTLPPPPAPPPKIAGAPAGAIAAAKTAVKAAAVKTRFPAAEDDEPEWRYVVGTFAIKIPVTNGKTLRLPEENTYSILKWRLNQMKPADRWRPVLERYLGYIEGRVTLRLNARHLK